MYSAKFFRTTLTLTVLLGVFKGCRAVESGLVRRAQSGGSLAPEDQGIAEGFDVPTEIPWQVYFDEFGRCAGALVHSDIVITSGSCLAAGIPTRVRVGSLSPTSGGVVVGVSGAVIHPDFDSANPNNGANIGVLKLATVLTSTIALMNEESLVPKSFSDLLFAAGLGADSSTTLATTLQGFFTYYVEDCFNINANYNPIFHICTEAFPATLCNGDSGAPLVMAGTRNIVGLAFSGTGGSCGSDDLNPNKTNFFTRMSSYTDWVKDTACDLSADEPHYCEKDKDEDHCFFDFIYDAFNSVFTFGDF